MQRLTLFASTGLFAFTGLLACNTDVAKHVGAPPASTPPASTPPAPTPAVPTSAPPVAAAAATPDGGASDSRSAGQPDCRFERPTIWTSGRLSWLGSCRAGFAQGTGVILREFAADLALAPERFYGSVQNGHLSVGVIRNANGSYTAPGNWVHGAPAAPLADDMAQRNVLINAFGVAAAAATAVSNSFAKEGDAELSRFYAEQARQLGEQMD